MAKNINKSFYDPARGTKDMISQKRSLKILVLEKLKFKTFTN